MSCHSSAATFVATSCYVSSRVHETLTAEKSRPFKAADINPVRRTSVHTQLLDLFATQLARPRTQAGGT